MKKIFFTFSVIAITLNCSAQNCEWSLVNGRAQLQSTISVPGKDATCLYRKIQRWLLASFNNPEDIAKAWIDDEYFGGKGYFSEVYKPGALRPLDFEYTFSIDVKNEKVRLTLSQGKILYDYPQDVNEGKPIEAYLDTLSKKKDKHTQQMIASINTRSVIFLKSLESFLMTESVSKDDW